MNRLNTGLVACGVTALFISACGNSNSGNSNKNAQCPTAGASAPMGNLQGIRTAGGTTTNPTTGGIPGNTPSTGIPTPGADTATNNCDTAAPGNLGNTPNAPTAPRTPNTQPNLPIPDGRGPTPSLTSLNGSWDFIDERCEDGTQSTRMQLTQRLFNEGSFYYSLNIKDNNVEEFYWIRDIIDAASNNTKMCTLMLKSTLSAAGNSFSLSRPAANFDDAGGITRCDRPSTSAEVIKNLRMIALGGTLTVETMSSPDCNGKKSLMLFLARTPN